MSNPTILIYQGKGAYKKSRRKNIADSSLFAFFGCFEGAPWFLSLINVLLPDIETYIDILISLFALW